jgi:hypothetical protein
MRKSSVRGPTVSSVWKLISRVVLNVAEVKSFDPGSFNNESASCAKEEMQTEKKKINPDSSFRIERYV